MDILIIIGVLWMLVVAFFVFGNKNKMMELVIKQKNKSVYRESDVDRDNIIDRGGMKIKFEFDRDNEVNPEELYHFIEDVEAVIEKNRKKKPNDTDEKPEPEEQLKMNNYIKINQLK